MSVTSSFVVCCVASVIQAAAVIGAAVCGLHWIVQQYRQDMLAGHTCLYALGTAVCFSAELRLYCGYFTWLLYNSHHHYWDYSVLQSWLWFFILPKLLCLLFGGTLYDWFDQVKRTSEVWCTLLRTAFFCALCSPLLACWLRLSIFMYNWDAATIFSL